MHRNALFFASGSVLTALLTGCTLSSPEALAEPGPAADGAKVIILQTTDVHHHASGTGSLSAADIGPVGSYARVAAYVNKVRADATAASIPVVLVDSGDWTMGTLYDLTIGQQPMATFFLDTLRYDCATLGNHEFDYTPTGLATMLAVSQSKFGFHTPIVATNTVLNGNKDLAPYMGTVILPSYTKVLPTGLKVGFIGLMGKEAASAAPAAAPVTFADYSKDWPSLQAKVDALRNAEGCNVVIALSHAGTDPATGGTTGEDVALAQHVTGIDVIASGHTHNVFPDGSAAHEVANGAWKTQIICAGAFTTNVSRIDLAYHSASKNTTVVGTPSSKLMTDANLVALGLPAPPRDSAQSVFVGQADATLNFGLSALFTQFFPDYSSTDTAKGLYHPVGAAAQDMRSNDQTPVLSPSGLGNLCADALRNVPNGILAKAVAAAMAANPGLTQLQAAQALGAAGYDLTPYTAGIIPTGVIRDGLDTGAISFANAYDVLPLGISPDGTQAIPVGYPLMSVYVDYADLKKICALQLLSQSNLTPSDYYLNLSGLAYTLDATAAASYFKHATAAAVLQMTQARAAAGSFGAIQALDDLHTLAVTTNSTALLTHAAGQNAFAAAMVTLNDASIPADPTVNLTVLGDVAVRGATDAATGTIALPTLIFQKATAAIATVEAFAPTDLACTGATSALPADKRVRVAGGLYAIVMMGAAQSKFGAAITAYAGPTGLATVSGADLPGAMANRINLGGPVAKVQELKEWMALVVSLITPPAAGGHFTNGLITSEYKSTANFTDFPTDGAAVTVRNATYPIQSIGQLMGTLKALTTAP